MSRRRKRRRLSAIRRQLGLVAVYAVVLLALIVAGTLLDRTTDQQETFGSLDGRFDSDIALEYNGRTLHYRENEITNYLLIGMDREEMENAGSRNGGQADFLLVLSIDRRHRTVTPVMIDRDTMTPVMTYGAFGDAAGERTMQICLALSYGGGDVSGSRNTAQAVSGLLRGVKIDRRMVMDLGGIALLNDAVGGVTVTLEDDLTTLDPSLVKGATVRLNGDKAEKFVRGRMTVADGTNASRMRRQRVYIHALTEKLSALLKNDDDALAEIFADLSGHVETDASESALLSDAKTYGDYEWRPMQMLPGTHHYGEDGFAEFHPDEPAMLDLIAGIWFH